MRLYVFATALALSACAAAPTKENISADYKVIPVAWDLRGRTLELKNYIRVAEQSGRLKVCASFQYLPERSGGIDLKDVLSIYLNRDSHLLIGTGDTAIRYEATSFGVFTRADPYQAEALCEVTDKKWTDSLRTAPLALNLQGVHVSWIPRH